MIVLYRDPSQGSSCGDCYHIKAKSTSQPCTADTNGIASAVIADARYVSVKALVTIGSWILLELSMNLMLRVVVVVV